MTPWFPGHVQKARRVIADLLRLADVVLEVVDARCPYASRNPEVDRLIGGRPRVLVLNKADLAHPPTTAAWVECLRGRGYVTGPVDSRTGKGVRELVRAVRDHVLPRPDRAPPALLDAAGRLKRQRKKTSMILLGIPNVGKSSLLNRLGDCGRAFRGYAPLPERHDAGPKFGRVADGYLRAIARTGALPGTTRGYQWVQVARDLRLLDVPGILWPRLEQPEVAEKLAFIGAVSPESIDQEVTAVRLLQALAAVAPMALGRYGIATGVPARQPGAAPAQPGALLAPSERGLPVSVLDHVAQAKHWLLDSGRPDRLRAAARILADFRDGRFGPVSLEHPQEFGRHFPPARRPN